MSWEDLNCDFPKELIELIIEINIPPKFKQWSWA